ncbi:DUF2680 domain-containing protein, partial [Bacillus altitudinis]|uniref:DUF2680 domain-containing protein n=1 Tax=Bacillus altitudinis TaxID=293387 RepID=UPI00307F4AC8
MNHPTTHIKKTTPFIILTILILFPFQLNTAHAETPQIQNPPLTHQVKLTTHQQKQIQLLQHQIFSKPKQLIQKYLHYTVLTNEQSTHITKRIHEHYN